jgi:3-hydroxymyristoyl/3-hydroxydecanoyl-(acyl carrier protein) dehydratase
MTRTESLSAYAAEHPAFAGHFPARPIVPGVLLLDAALHRICAAHDLNADACRIAVAKFISPVEPGEALQLSHTPDSQGGVRFSLHAAGSARLVVSGQVHCAAGQATLHPAP